MSIILSEIEVKVRKLIEVQRQLIEANNEEEIQEGRKLIKELIKEIDQCVSILNTKE